MNIFEFLKLHVLFKMDSWGLIYAKEARNVKKLLYW